MTARLSAFSLILVASYATVWGWHYLAADRSLVVFGGDQSPTYPNIPLQAFFPDPGSASPLPGIAFLGGLIVLGVLLVVLIVTRRRQVAI